MEENYFREHFLPFDSLQFRGKHDSSPWPLWCTPFNLFFYTVWGNKLCKYCCCQVKSCGYFSCFEMKRSIVLCKFKNKKYFTHETLLKVIFSHMHWNQTKTQFVFIPETRGDGFKTDRLICSEQTSGLIEVHCHSSCYYGNSTQDCHNANWYQVQQCNGVLNNSWSLF